MRKGQEKEKAMNVAECNACANAQKLNGPDRNSELGWVFGKKNNCLLRSFKVETS